jgi:hypothetical protein
MSKIYCVTELHASLVLKACFRRAKFLQISGYSKPGGGEGHLEIFLSVEPVLN